jgi:DNA-binding LacI/PurR family transcriptional regulator
MAVNLLHQRTGMLALTISVPDGMTVGLTDLDFTVRFISAASARALERGYALVIAPPTGNMSFGSLAVDGGIVIDPLAADASVAALEERGLPVVTSGRDPALPAEAGWWVDNDIEGATGQLLDHLRDTGAERIAMIAPPSVYSYSLDYRRGYERWCEKAGCPPNIAEAESGLTEMAAYETAMRLLTAEPRPDAIYGALDRYALAAILAASTLGLRVPADLRVAAGIDSDVGRSCDPPITAIDLHPGLVGEAAVELLLERVEGPGGAPKHSVLPTTLHVRASSVDGPVGRPAPQPPR